ncbi:unnamed protein product [Heligmosomoides polygyrus]|uniref:Uncharacterized protein n=1 Tax=Heligmosomoides polygyrus TaxID=6339 RepID=A0A183G5B7_HELPZ|nr:unnamed protein product [Heligmosomoides polygyrus]
MGPSRGKRLGGEMSPAGTIGFVTDEVSWPVWRPKAIRAVRLRPGSPHVSGLSWLHLSGRKSIPEHCPDREDGTHIMQDGLIADEIRRLDLEEQLQSFNDSLKRDDNDGSIHSILDGDVDLDLFQHVKRTKKELEYIAETYCNNYETFYHSTVNGGKDKDAITRKKALLSQMAEHISTLGEEHRTPEQVEQKIRDELKRVKKYMAAKKEGGLLAGKREIVLSSPQQMIADVIERTLVEPIKPKCGEGSSLDEAVVVDTSSVDIPTAGSSMEVSPPLFSRRTASPIQMRRKKRRLSQRELPQRPFDDFRCDFDFVKEKRRAVEDDMKYARAKLEAVTAERDYWMAKIDVLDLERQFWMRELERSLSSRF